METCDCVIHLDFDYLTLYKDGRTGNPILGKDLTDYEMPTLEEETSLLREDVINKVLSDFKSKFPDFKCTPESTNLLENERFSLELGNDEWSMTLKLSQKVLAGSENLQDELFNIYFEGLQESVLIYFDSIYVTRDSYLTEYITKDTFRPGINSYR